MNDDDDKMRIIINQGIKLTRTDTNLYASKTRTLVRTKTHIVITRLVFFTNDQMGRPFLFPLVPTSSLSSSSSCVPMVCYALSHSHCRGLDSRISSSSRGVVVGAGPSSVLHYYFHGPCHAWALLLWLRLVFGGELRKRCMKVRKRPDGTDERYGGKVAF